jgi:acetoin utilization deacetylase AcuC-like enzyme
VAVLDIDYHHGNGTQNIFYERKDVCFVSMLVQEGGYSLPNLKAGSRNFITGISWI